MAAASSEPQTVTITINGIEVQVPKGELVVESVKRIGLEIPIFCYHPRMAPVGMCRMCLVDVGFTQPDGSVRMMPKPQAGCTLPADAGMAIFTDSKKVQEDRRGVLEFLLVNHPLDCPICDRGGECPLQNNTIFYGPSTTRFAEVKRHLPKAFPLSKYVTLDLERCIQCGRCVRFTEEISGDAQLAFRFRGALMQPSTYALTDFDSRFSGNVIEICPVGALTSTDYRFRARPWDLESSPSICTECSNGCATWFDHRAGNLVRVNGRTNEQVNEEWTCDKGKFGQEYLNSPDRLTAPWLRSGDSMVQCEWRDAYRFVLEVTKGAGDRAAVLIGPRSSNETAYLARRVAQEIIKTDNIDHRWTAHFDELPSVSSTIANFETARNTLVFGGNFAAEQPIIYLRLRKGWLRHGARVIVASTEPTEAEAFAYASLRYSPGSEALLLRLLLERANPERIAKETGVAAHQAAKVLDCLTDDTIIAASRTLLNLPDGDEVVSLLRNLGGRFNLFATSANEQGAAELGFMPTAGGKSTHEILRACAQGSIEVLWLLECDPLELHQDRDLVNSALEAVRVLIVQDHSRSEVSSYASVILPSCAFSESDGTYVNAERRVQLSRRVVPPKGDAKPGWKLFADLQLRVTGSSPPFSAEEVFELIAAERPAFRDLSYESLAGDGVLLGAEAGTSREAHR